MLGFHEFLFDRVRCHHYHCDLMLSFSQTNILPQFVDPRRLVGKGATLNGHIDLALCDRLAVAVTEICQPIAVNLLFYIEDCGRKAVHVKSSAIVQVGCHRCLRTMPLQLECDTILGIVWTEEEACALPKELDPWIVTEDEGDIAQLIEDELLLALPFVIYHDESDTTCKTLLNGSAFKRKPNNQEINSQESPFEALKVLKDKDFDK